jgi:alkylation response protein AidB-like acyl-CoA dehydrogenase
LRWIVLILRRIGAIYEGTSNIQLETIAKLLKKDYV